MALPLLSATINLARATQATPPKSRFLGGHERTPVTSLDVLAIRRLARRLPRGIKRAFRHLPGADRIRAFIVDKPRLPGPEPGQIRAVVYLPTWVRWDSMRQRPQYILRAFAGHGHPVYFVDHEEKEVRHSDGVQICPTLGDVPRSGVILYTHFAPQRHLIDLFDDAVVVYDILDDLSIYDADEVGLPEDRKVRSHHPHLIGRADIVMVSNGVLADKHRHERPDLVEVHNGVDPEMFGGATQRPADLPSGDRPIVGYHGMVSTWFDFDLMERVARRREGLDFVVVGPTDPRVEGRVEELAKLPNITFLGEKPSDDIPAYVQAFDVGVIWFKVDDMTRGVTPLKMYEYIAAGVPCVATPLPACEDEPLVVTAADGDSMLSAIDGSLGTGGPQLQMAAREHSWEARLSPVIERLESLGNLRV